MGIKFREDLFSRISISAIFFTIAENAKLKTHEIKYHYYSFKYFPNSDRLKGHA